MAVERVEQRLRKVTAGLNDAGVRYAVIGETGRGSTEYCGVLV